MKLINLKKRLKPLLKKYGVNSTSYLTMMNENRHFLSSSIDGYISYRKYWNNMVVLGDPVCSPKKTSKIINEIKELSKDEGLNICFFAANKTNLQTFKNAGYRCMFIGDEAIIDLEKFSLRGNKMENVRRGINHAKICNITVKEYCPNTNRNHVIERELHEISKDWQRKLKGTPELSFMVSSFDIDIPTDRRFFIASKNNQIEGFLVYVPIYATNSYYLDLNRRRINAPNGVMELLMSESFEIFRQEGANSIHLGLSPFSHISLEDDKKNYFFNRVMRFLFNHFEFLYPAKSQHFFKNKFHPHWEKCYLFAYPNFSVSMVYAIFRALCPDGISGVITHKLGNRKSDNSISR